MKSVSGRPAVKVIINYQLHSLSRVSELFLKGEARMGEISVSECGLTCVCGLPRFHVCAS